MKCSDCDNLGWVSDEGEQVWGWCWYRRSCPDPDIDRDCPNFALKRPPMLQQLKAENENLRAEMERMEACIYYKAGGFCRYGGDDPANVCVLGPCAHEVAAQKFIAEAAAEKGERDHPTPPEPLTQEQLREMDGQPVYIISKAHTISEWNIPKGVGEIVIAYDVPCAGMKSVIPSVEFIDGKNLSVEKYGSDWIAYRRPPEGDEENE